MCRADVAQQSNVRFARREGYIIHLVRRQCRKLGKRFPTFFVTISRSVLTLGSLCLYRTQREAKIKLDKSYRATIHISYIYFVYSMQ